MAHDTPVNQAPKRLYSELSPESTQIFTSEEVLKRILDDRLDAKLARLDETDKKVEALSIKVGNIDLRCSGVYDAQITQDMAIARLTRENEELKRKLTQMETYSRRDNLVFYGLPERRNEVVEASILKLLFEAKIDMDSNSIVRAHRLGKFVNGKTRPVIVRFHHFKNKMYVLRSSSQIIQCSPFKLRISEDFPQEVLDNRKVLLPVYHTARKILPKEKRVNLVADQLFIGAKRYTVSNIHELPDELSPHSVATPSNDETVAFFTKYSQFSNHHPCMFEVNGDTYTSAEQWLMSQKAQLFNDKRTHAKIMASSDPVYIKALGKEIADFEQEQWEKEAPDVILAGLKAKFIQNEDLANTLLATGEKHIIEASTDPFWGVGLNLWSGDLFNPEKWTGKNTLGTALMSVRKTLADIQKYSASYDTHDGDNDNDD